MVFIFMDYRIQSGELSYLVYCGEKCQSSIKEKKRKEKKRKTKQKKKERNWEKNEQNMKEDKTWINAGNFTKMEPHEHAESWKVGK